MVINYKAINRQRKLIALYTTDERVGCGKRRCCERVACEKAMQSDVNDGIFFYGACSSFTKYMHLYCR